MNKWLVAIAITLGVILILGFYVRSYIGWDPKYDESRLVGLTREEVIAKCGKPYYDPLATGRWRDEVQDGPLYLCYTGPAGQRYAVRFEHGKVAKVERSSR